MRAYIIFLSLPVLLLALALKQRLSFYHVPHVRGHLLVRADPNQIGILKIWLDVLVPSAGVF